MDEVILIAHLPGVRMDPKSVGFLGTKIELQHLPWDQYHALTSGAHDRQSEYIQGDPVVLVASLPSPLVAPQNPNGSAFAESKVPSDNIDMLRYLPNPETLAWGMDIVEAAWSLLSLTKPLSGFVPPRKSAMFLVPQGGKEFAWQDTTVGGIQVQGEADHEYFFADRLSATALSLDDIGQADALTGLIPTLRDAPALAAALQSLLAAQDPALGRMEHALLCTVALEELLLAGQTTNLRRSFTERLAALVPPAMSDAVPAKSLRRLYDLRSDFLHGRSDDPGLDAPEVLALAPNLLSSAIRSLAQAVQGGAVIEDILAGGPEALSAIAVSTPWQPISQFRPENRMSGHRHSIVTAIDNRMAAPEDTTLVWSPYLGIAAPPDSVPIGQTDATCFMPLAFEELMLIEDRDVRGDYLQRLMSGIATGELPDVGRSCLMMPLAGGDLNDLRARDPHDYAPVRAFTIALRALGFGGFTDPVLLGEYIYQGGVRLRLPTVFRQTLLMRYIEEYEEPDVGTLMQAEALRDTVLDIAQHYPSLNQLLTLLREAHFHPVVTDEVRARLCFAFIDGVIGRLSGDDVAGQVATLGQQVAPGDVGAWFATDARAMRNGLAHRDGAPVDARAFATLLTFAQRLALMLLRFVQQSHPDDTISHKAFRAHLKAGLNR